METVFGIMGVIVWCALGAAGHAVYQDKGYQGSVSLGAILWGGPIHLLMAVVAPNRRSREDHEAWKRFRNHDD